MDEKTKYEIIECVKSSFLGQHGGSVGNTVTSQQGHWFESWLFEFACSSCVGISVSLCVSCAMI